MAQLMSDCSAKFTCLVQSPVFLGKGWRDTWKVRIQIWWSETRIGIQGIGRRIGIHLYTEQFQKVHTFSYVIYIHILYVTYNHITYVVRIQVTWHRLHLSSEGRPQIFIMRNHLFMRRKLGHQYKRPYFKIVPSDFVGKNSRFSDADAQKLDLHVKQTWGAILSDIAGEYRLRIWNCWVLLHRFRPAFLSSTGYIWWYSQIMELH